MNKWFDYLWYEYKHTNETDYCTAFPDYFLGYNFKKPCSIHDKFNRGHGIPGREEPSGFIELQFVFWKSTIREVHRSYLGIIHLLFGYFLTFLLWTATTISFPFWYRFNL